MTEIEQSGVPVEEEVETGIRNGSDSGTKISDQENGYLKDIYYNPGSPVASSGFHKINLTPGSQRAIYRT